MKTKKITIQLYKFCELSEDIQNKLISREVEFLINLYNSNGEKYLSKKQLESLERAFAKSEEMQTPWFLPGYAYDELKDEILATLGKEEYISNGMELREILPIAE